MSLDKEDIEIIEKLIYRNNDDVAISIKRSFERLEERIDSSTARLISRIADIEDKLDIIHIEDDPLMD